MMNPVTDVSNQYFFFHAIFHSSLKHLVLSYMQKLHFIFYVNSKYPWFQICTWMEFGVIFILPFINRVLLKDHEIHVVIKS